MAIKPIMREVLKVFRFFISIFPECCVLRARLTINRRAVKSPEQVFGSGSGVPVIVTRMKKRILFEAIVSNPDDAKAAESGGADRFELCSALALGGLTPSIGTVREIKAVTDVPVMCMVRPREGGMCYSDGEYQSMLRDVDALLEAGADGLVFGFLKQDGSLDLKRGIHLIKK